MTLVVRAVLWVVAYLGAVLSPLVFAALDAGHPDHGFWTNFSVALGFVGLAMMGLEFVLVARADRHRPERGDEPRTAHAARRDGAAGAARPRPDPARRAAVQQRPVDPRGRGRGVLARRDAGPRRMGARPEAAGGVRRRLAGA